MTTKGPGPNARARTEAADGTRKRLLVRTAVATAAMAALLAGLELVDDGGAPPELAPPAQAAVPPVEPDPTASADGAGGTSPAAAGTIAPVAPDAGTPAGDASAFVPTPVPSSSAADALAATPVPPTAAAVAEPATPAAPLVPAVAPPVVPSAAAVPVAEPLAPGYLVQLGVFGAPANAESLRAELAAQGYPAHVQSRVVLGPFPNVKAAKATEEKLRRERRLDGIIMAPRKP